MAKWCSVIPVDPDYIDRASLLSKPFEFERGILLGQIPDWVRSSTVTEHMSFHERESVVKRARLALVAEYAADSFGAPDPTWKGKTPRGKQETALEKLSLCLLAAWLAKPSALKCDLYIHAN